MLELYLPLLFTTIILVIKDLLVLNFLCIFLFEKVLPVLRNCRKIISKLYMIPYDQNNTLTKPYLLQKKATRCAGARPLVTGRGQSTLSGSAATFYNTIQYK